MPRHPLLKEFENLAQIHEVPVEVVDDVIKNGNNSKHIRATTLHHGCPHVLDSPSRAVRLEYSVTGGEWFVTATLGIDLAKGPDKTAAIDVAPPPLADPLDDLYPPHAGANERDH